MVNQSDHLNDSLNVLSGFRKAFYQSLLGIPCGCNKAACVIDLQILVRAIMWHLIPTGDIWPSAKSGDCTSCRPSDWIELMRMISLRHPPVKHSRYDNLGVSTSESLKIVLYRHGSLENAYLALPPVLLRTPMRNLSKECTLCYDIWNSRHCESEFHHISW